MDTGAGRRRRRTYSAQFKAEAVAVCRRPGASVSAAALERSMNANVLRRWVLEAERAEAGIVSPVRALPSPSPKESFVAVPMAPKGAAVAPFRVVIRRGNLTVNVQWPASAMHECAIWLHEVLK